MKQRGKQRPDLKDVRPAAVMFGKVGSTGWRFIRNIHDHKVNRKEGDFSHLHDKVADPGDAA